MSLLYLAWDIFRWMEFELHGISTKNKSSMKGGLRNLTCKFDWEKSYGFNPNLISNDEFNLVTLLMQIEQPYQIFDEDKKI
jgi:hypothetical protein